MSFSDICFIFSFPSTLHAALSLALQWTMEDEEEVEREKRRRVRGSSSATEADGDLSPPPREVAASDSAPGAPNTTDTTEASREMPRGRSR